jgi:hypothetical protein
MGSGEIGSNGSVHYTFKHDDSPGGPAHYKDYDPIPYDRIGRGTGGQPKIHPASFAVRMRFKDAVEAGNALKAAAGTMASVPGGGGIYVTCFVPAVAPPRPTPDADPFFEIKIDW